MPELPEVETVRVGLKRLLPHKIIQAVEHDWEKGFPNTAADVEQFLLGAEILHIERRGKVLIIHLSTHYSLLIHLKMTGQLVFQGGEHFGAGHPNKSLRSPLPDTSTRVTFHFSDGSTLYFNDQRKFGWVRLLPDLEIDNIDFFKKLGPDPLASDFTVAQFKVRLLKRPNASIKAVLLDQSIIAGVGNIYADESLWAARIHPAELVKNISTNKMNTLFKELRNVLALSIAKGGSTDRNYVDAEGNKGSYLSFAKVFRKQNTACPRCGHTIIKTRVAGRGTHLCPHCQKLTRKP